jgi:uncharacterized protein (TIGR02996 family)
MTPESLRDAVVNRRARRGELSFQTWGVNAPDMLRAQEAAGWAPHQSSQYSSVAQTLALAAIKRANDETGTRVHQTDFFKLAIECCFDGYELGCVLTGAGGDGKGITINSAGAVTAFANRSMKQLSTLDGVLRETFALVFAERLEKVNAEHREVAATMFRYAMGGGLLLQHTESEGKHSLIEALLQKAPKKKRVVEPEAREAPANDALLDAILAAPHDDAPRLVYADWLSEHGDPRGEFIQIQCTLGRTLMGAGATTATPLANNALKNLSVEELKERETRLIKLHEKKWKLEAPSLRSWYWRRGFVFAGVADAQQFADAMPKLLRVPLERLNLTGFKASEVNVLLKAPAYSTLECIDFSSNRLSVRSAAVLRAPMFANVKRLSLSGNDFSRADTMRVVSEALDTMPRLTHLYLGYSKMTDDTLEILSQTNAFTRLEALDVHHNNLSSDALHVLTRAKSLQYLSASPLFGGAAGSDEEFYVTMLRAAPESMKKLASTVEHRREGISTKVFSELRARFEFVKQHSATFFDVDW